MEAENVISTKKLLVKSLPCDIDAFAEMLRMLNLTEPHAFHSFGRRRALLEYESVDVAQVALNELQQVNDQLDKPLRVSAFGPRLQADGSTTTASTQKKKKLVNKASQTTTTNNKHSNSKQLGLIDTIYVDGAGPADLRQQHPVNIDDADDALINNSAETVPYPPPPPLPLLTTKTKKSRKSKQLSMQPYNYVVAVDFEATCWENQAPPQWREAEIIEFPAVLVNLKSGKIEAEFHQYVMPIESPRLSGYCTELTGIQQKTVDNGIPLQTALMMFHEWLRKELRARNLLLPKMRKDNILGNCAFVTWTDWDFGMCLSKECNRKRVRKQLYFNQWIDVRAIYREWYKYRPVNFSEALTHVGLTFEGRAHSGIDDAKNLGALVCKMVRDGALLSITKDLTPYQQLNANCVL